MVLRILRVKANFDLPASTFGQSGTHLYRVLTKKRLRSCVDMWDTERGCNGVMYVLSSCRRCGGPQDLPPQPRNPTL